MYRKHIKMSQNRQAAEPENILKSRFLHHLSNLPAVVVAWNLASGAYSTVKSSHNVLHRSLESSEKVVSFLCKQAMPMVNRFQPQANALDEVALRSLVRLETIIAIIMQQPENFLNFIRSKYNEMVESGLHKYEDVKQTALLTATDIKGRGMESSNEFLNSPSGQLVVMALNSTFDAYEMYLDHILPPLGDERADLVFGDRARPPILERADALTETLRERCYKYSLLYVQNMRIRGKLSLAKLANRSVVNYEFA